MIRHIGKYLFFIAGLTACFFSFCKGQTLKTSVDKNEILIGEQIKMKVDADFPPGVYNVRWLVIPDSLQHFEVLDRSKIDSVYSDDKLTHLSQTFTLTSFDSGQWVIPSFAIKFYPVNNDTIINAVTDSVPVTVSFSPSDTTNQLRDIKPIREVEAPNYLWYWIGGSLLLILLIVLIGWL